MNIEDNGLVQVDVDKLIGTTFAESYEILSVLGKGGISVVYKARYVPLDQLVAVKVLQAHLAANPTVLQRLRLEAKLAHSIEHPNIVRVLRLQIDEGGFPFLVCDLVDGKTLQAVLAQEGPLSEKRFLGVLEQIMSALEHAHKNGVVHRDIKPSNIMLTTEGEQTDIVKVVDFGIAKLLEDSAAATPSKSMSSSGNVFGSPSYMSPEQCSGAQTDARTDIYSLGCLMYEALTGVAAFCGDTTFDTMRQQMETLPRPLREVAPQSNISPALENAIMAALQKEPSHRPQSIAELRALVLGDDTYKLQITSQTVRRGMPVKAGIILALSGLAVVCAGVFVFFLHSTSQDQSYNATTGGELPAPAAQVDARQFETATGATRMASFLKKNQRREEALQVYLRANELLASQLTKTPLNTVLEIKQNIGAIYAEKGLHEAAYPFRVQAAEIAKTMNKTAYGNALVQVAATLNGSGRHEEALREAQRAAQMLEADLKNSGQPQIYQRHRHHDCGNAWGQVADCYNALKRSEEAGRALSRKREHYNLSIGMGLSNRAIEEDTLLLMNTVRDQAVNCHSRGRSADAVKVMQQWLALEKGLPRLTGHSAALDDTFERGSGHVLLANLLSATSNNSQALKEFDLAIQLFTECTLADPDSHLGAVYYHKAIHHYRVGELKAGDEAARLSKKFWQAAGEDASLRNVAQTLAKSREHALGRIDQNQSQPKPNR